MHGQRNIKRNVFRGFTLGNLNTFYKLKQILTSSVK